MTEFAQEGDKPLAGLNVVELHAIGPVPFAGMQLQQLGAQVVRVCPPVNRTVGIAIEDRFDLLNHGKQRISLDLKNSADHEAFLEKLSDCDVLLEGFRPGVMERLELDPLQLTRRFPKLVIGRLSGFGRQGDLAPRAGHDINYLALSGILCAIGAPDKPAVPLNLIADFGGGAMHLLTGVLCRLVQRGIHGHGGIVETSILAGTIGLTGMLYSLRAADQWTLEREDNLLDGGVPFYKVYRTQDEKFVAVGAIEPVFFKNLLKLTSLQRVIKVEHQYQEKRWPSMTLALQSAFARRTRDEWGLDAQQLDCCVSPVLDFDEATCYPHNLRNGWINPYPFPHPGPVLHFEKKPE